MVRILSSDLLIIDHLADLEGNPILQSFIDKFGFSPEKDKIQISKKDSEEFFEAYKKIFYTTKPGGSSANVLTTLKKIVGADAQINFLGITDNTPEGQLIARSVKEAGFNLLPETIPSSIEPECATSYVINLPDKKDEHGNVQHGDRYIATYPGNAKEFLKSELITPELIAANDIIFVQGSLWEKFDHEFANKLTDLRWKQGKELWLALPTKAKFGKENADLFQYIIPSANVVLGNDNELKRISKTDNLGVALEKLQVAFRQDEFRKHGKIQRRPQVGFITTGGKGAYVVTKDEITEIPVFPLPQEKIKTKLGAGDSAFGGFGAAYIAGMDPIASAYFAMALAAAKLTIRGPRMEDPMGTLEQIAPAQANMIREKLRQQAPSSLRHRP